MEGYPVDLNRLMWLGAGAGSKGIAAGLVSGLAPQAGITPDVAAGFIGFFLAQQGGGRIGPFGEGMLISAIGQLVRQPIEGIFGKLGKGGVVATPSPSPAPTNSVAGGDAIDLYLLRRYGLS